MHRTVEEQRATRTRGKCSVLHDVRKETWSISKDKKENLPKKEAAVDRAIELLFVRWTVNKYCKSNVTHRYH